MESSLPGGVISYNIIQFQGSATQRHVKVELKIIGKSEQKCFGFGVRLSFLLGRSCKH